MSHGLRHIVDDLLGFQNVHDVERPDAEGNRPLHLACLGGQLHIVKALVSEDVQLDSVLDRGETPLLVALSHGQTDCAMFLLEKGDRPTSIPQRAPSGQQPACKGRDQTPGSVRPWAGANAEAKDRVGVSALHIAAGRSMAKVARALLKRGVDPHAHSKAGETPRRLLRVSRSEAVYSLLHEHQLARLITAWQAGVWAGHTL